MQLKKILGTHAYWVINKDLANDIGLHATLVLQHFIDLQSNFFEDGGFYQQQSRILEDLPISLKCLRKEIKVLQSKGFITVVKRGVPAKNHYTVNEAHILSYLSSITSSIQSGTTSSAPEARLEVPKEAPLEVTQRHDKHKELNNTKNKDNTNIDDVLGKIFFKIVELYPKNRIGNRQHGLKKFKQLDTEQAKLALKNLDRYLKVSNGYVKSLLNYITEECYTEAWLQAEEKTKQSKTDTKINKSIGVKTFNKNYGDI